MADFLPAIAVAADDSQVIGYRRVTALERPPVHLHPVRPVFGMLDMPQAESWRCGDTVAFQVAVSNPAPGGTWGAPVFADTSFFEPVWYRVIGVCRRRAIVRALT